MSAEIDALYAAAASPGPLPAEIETAAMTRLRQEARARILGNGVCTQPVELECTRDSRSPAGGSAQGALEVGAPTADVLGGNEIGSSGDGKRTFVFEVDEADAEWFDDSPTAGLRISFLPLIWTLIAGAAAVLIGIVSDSLVLIAFGGL